MSEFECRYGHYVRFGEDCKACKADGRFGERTYYMDELSAGAWRRKEEQEEAQARREDAESDEE